MTLLDPRAELVAQQALLLKTRAEIRRLRAELAPKRLSHAARKDRRAAILRDLDLDDSVEVVAARYNLTELYVARLGWKAGLKPRRDAPERRRTKRPLTDAQRAIVADYRAPGATLVSVGALHGVSYERVRQLVVSYEAETGTAVPRTPKTARGPRVTLTCPGCGRTVEVQPSVARSGSPYCLSCALLIRSDRIPPAQIEDWVRQRLAGIPWLRMALAAGYKSNTSASVPRAVYVRLRAEGRTADIAALWPRGIPHWLRRHEGTPR